jgi:hypothetical protein
VFFAAVIHDAPICSAEGTYCVHWLLQLTVDAKEAARVVEDVTARLAAATSGQS